MLTALPRSVASLAAVTLAAVSMASFPSRADESGGPLRITRQSLALLDRCEARATPPPSTEIETFKESANRARTAASKLASDADARACGFKSLTQLSDFHIRVAVAISDKVDAEALRKYPDGLGAVRARREEVWKDQLRQGKITQADLEQRRKMLDDVEAMVTRAAARRRRAREGRPRCLDASGLLESDASTLAQVMGAETATEVAKQREELARTETAIAASAARQPPLSDEERAVLQDARQ